MPEEIDKSDKETEKVVKKMYPRRPMNVIIECVEITGRPGHCPIYKLGTRMIITPDSPVKMEYPTGMPPRAGGPCFSFLSGFSAWYRPLIRGVDPKALGLNGNDGEAYIGCTSCTITDKTPNASGTAIFKIYRVPHEEKE